MHKKLSSKHEGMIVLNLLRAVADENIKSQRHLASELGVALGLVNLYLKRCVTKGLVKIAQVPARRYSYYLTPRGFAEKSRLTAKYLGQSFQFFREARSSAGLCLDSISAAGHSRVVLIGWSDLAQIVILCALERGGAIAAVVSKGTKTSEFVGIPVVPDFASVGLSRYAVMVTDFIHSLQSYRLACEAVGAENVFIPNLLDIESRGRA